MHNVGVKVLQEVVVLLHSGTSLTPHFSCRGILSTLCREPCFPAADGGCNLRSVWPERPAEKQETQQTLTSVFVVFKSCRGSKN